MVTFSGASADVVLQEECDRVPRWQTVVLVVLVTGSAPSRPPLSMLPDSRAPGMLACPVSQFNSGGISTSISQSPGPATSLQQ